MSSLTTMYSIQKKKLDREGYVKRKEQVQEVKNKISSVSDDYVNYINKNIAKVSESLADGAKGISVMEQLGGSFTDKREKSGTADEKLSSYASELTSEISDCQKKIDSLDQEINRMQSKYNREVAEEKEAARKALEKIEQKGRDLFGL